MIRQDMSIETAGDILDVMDQDNFTLTTIELDQGEKIPSNLNQFDGMFCMGGPMDTWMEKEYPWLIEEKNKIKEFVVNLEKPYLGFCLGCQLLGEILGGNVVKSTHPEIGILDILMDSRYSNDHLFGEFNSSFKALQWHSYEVQGLESNNNVTLLGSSPSTKYQIFKYKNHAYGIQFHIEIKDNTVSQWGCVQEYKKALEDSLGKEALKKFDVKAQENMKLMNFNAENLYKNFKKIL